MGFDGSHRAAHQIGDLRLRQVVVEPQHQRRTLPDRQLREGAAHLLGHRTGLAHVTGTGQIGQVGARDLPAPSGPPPRSVGVDQDAAQIRVGIAAGVQPIPHLVQLAQAGLHEVLGRVPIPGEQDRCSQVVVSPASHEAHEIRVHPVSSRRVNVGQSPLTLLETHLRLTSCGPHRGGAMHLPACP
jgi:hypothetical protein